jgi:hypothetical protein
MARALLAPHPSKKFFREANKEMEREERPVAYGVLHGR